MIIKKNTTNMQRYQKRLIENLETKKRAKNG